MDQVQYTLVDTQEALVPLVELLKKAKEVALDTEADSMHHFHHRLCLLQITVEDTNWLVDPLSDIDLGFFWKSLDKTLLILHGADYDLRMMFKHFQFVPYKIWDTMLAAQLLGDEKLGLAHQVESNFSVHLAKGNQKADWTIRPLPEDMKVYAALDTVYLFPLKSLQVARLEELGRKSWLEESCDTLIESAQSPEKIVVDPWRMRGSSRMNSRELVILRSVWQWRENMALQWDRPPFKVLSPQLLQECVQRIAKSTTPSRKHLPKLPRNFHGEILQSFLDSLLEPLSLEPSLWPERKISKSKPSNSPNSAVLEKLKTHRDALGESLKIDPTLIANRHQMATLALHADDAITDELRVKCNLMKWQFTLLTPGLN